MKSECRIRKRNLRGRCGKKTSLFGRVDQSTLRRFGHVESMDGGRLTKRTYVADVDKFRSRGRMGLWSLRAEGS